MAMETQPTQSKQSSGCLKESGWARKRIMGKTFLCHVSQPSPHQRSRFLRDWYEVFFSLPIWLLLPLVCLPLCPQSRKTRPRPSRPQYPAFVQNSGPLCRPGQQTSTGSRNKYSYPSLDVRWLFTWRDPEFCVNTGYKHISKPKFSRFRLRLLVLFILLWASPWSGTSAVVIHIYRRAKDLLSIS